MHWLYPGIATQKLGPNLVQASIKTMDYKRMAGGGSTSWSATWESCLYARLGKGDEAWAALQRTVDKFTTPRLMSLHPSLGPVDEKNCRTCYRPRAPGTTAEPSGTNEGKYPAGRKTSGTKKRTLTTQDGSMFQLDGNLGFAAATVEMLLHSHVRGEITILPALPHVWAQEGGAVEELHGRGHVLCGKLVS